jgi:MoxR-like ATPase
MKNKKPDDLQSVEQLHKTYESICGELERVVVGQRAVLDELLMAVFAGGHCLLVGVPGLAKTLIVRSLAATLSLSFNRIQFTPDLMPSDITGTDVIREDRATGSRELVFLPGPIFAQVILADEINRTPPKTQAALLEAMQERQVSVGRKRHILESPFFVLATQNPIEQEGTYPLPEAQLDRFMFQVNIDYPSQGDELEMVRRTTSVDQPQLKPLLDAETILAFQKTVRAIPVPDFLSKAAVELVRRSRPGDVAEDFVNEFIRWGAGPRAGQYLVLAAKARAVLQGRLHVEADDLRAAAYPVLRHRIIPHFHAEAEGVDTEQLIDRLVERL